MLGELSTGLTKALSGKKPTENKEIPPVEVVNFSAVTEILASLLFLLQTVAPDVTEILNTTLAETNKELQNQQTVSEATDVPTTDETVS